MKKKFFILHVFYVLSYPTPVKCCDNIPIILFSIQSECIWEKQTGHIPTKCGICLNENNGMIMETYEDSTSTQSITISRKSSFEPLLLVGLLMQEILRKHKLAKQNEEGSDFNNDRYTRCKEMIVERLNNLVKAIEQYQKKFPCNSVDTLPEFTAKNKCVIRYYKKNNIDMNNPCKTINFSSNNKPIVFEDKVVVPKTSFTIELNTIQSAEQDSTPLLLPHLLSMFVLLSTPAHESIMLYQPEIKKKIIKGIQERIEDL